MKFSRIAGIEKDWSRITLGCWQIAPSDGWGDIFSPKEAEKVYILHLIAKSPPSIPQKVMETVNQNVVSEKHWGHKKNQSSLFQKYGQNLIKH